MLTDPGRAAGVDAVAVEGSDALPAGELAVIVVNYNTREYLQPCFDALRVGLEGLDARVCLVDNCSTDGSAEYARERFPWVHTIRTPYNGGYGYANNVGLRACGFDLSRPDGPCPFGYVLLLNPDAMVDPAAVRQLVALLKANPDIGTVGPRMLRADGRLDRACRRGEPTPLTSFYHLSGLARAFPDSPRFARYNMTFLSEDQQADVDALVGACMLLRGEVIRQVGGMDERFFMYGEDLDLCLRIRQAGWRVVYYPDARVEHHKGRSTRKVSRRMIREFYRSMVLFHRKHYASRFPRVVNAGIYAAISLLCRVKLLVDRLTPPERRAVGSAAD